MLTLSVYFHDMGLLISRKEFDGRNSNPEYQRYISDVLPSRHDANDFLSKLSALQDLKKGKLLFEENVRYHHGDRVSGGSREW